ncbi:MAG: hypothetical protein GY814_17350 [Gammaproteobacteria bacterium]|nr:hypothetical protein [Gammaproteobacteria bacterium]
MDRFTRNYSIGLGICVLIVLVWALYEDPQVSDLNQLLKQDRGVTDYPYQFQVIRLQNGVATMSTPRSTEFPVFRALGIIYPHLANRAQDNPEMMKAQQELAQTQKRAKAIVIESDLAVSVRWELDRDWISQHGVYLNQGR